MIDLNIDGSYKMNNKMKYFLIFFFSHCFSRLCTVKHNGEAPNNTHNLEGLDRDSSGSESVWSAFSSVLWYLPSNRSCGSSLCSCKVGPSQPFSLNLISMFLSKLNSYFIWSSIQLFLNHYYQWFLELRWCVWHNSTTSKLKLRWNSYTK